MEVEGQTIELAPDVLLIETTAAEGFACAEDAGYLVGLNTTLTDELVREGLIREILRTVQDARKQAGLNVSDRIVLNIDGNEPVMFQALVSVGFRAGRWLPLTARENIPGP